MKSERVKVRNGLCLCEVRGSIVKKEAGGEAGL